MLVAHIYEQGSGGAPTQANVVLPAFGVSKEVPDDMWKGFWGAKAGNQRCGLSEHKLRSSVQKHLLKKGEKKTGKELGCQAVEGSDFKGIVQTGSSWHPTACLCSSHLRYL